MDKVRIYACGGTGGQGSGQVGGLGGDGGDVYVRSVKGSCLSHLVRKESRRFIGGTGGSASRSRLRGKKGDHVTISLPPGTVIYDHQEKEMVLPCATCMHALVFIV